MEDFARVMEEYDLIIVCDVCGFSCHRDGNEMVCCDSCDVSVHQICYGVREIPEGRWLCACCKLGLQPPCAVCPKKGGAMKSNSSGTKWVHVSCAVWIPEVGIGSIKMMEPITNLEDIPPSRWALTCALCQIPAGVCIQCSAKGCTTAYHASCHVKYGLEIQTDIEDNRLTLRSYCEAHCKYNQNPVLALPKGSSRQI